MFWTIRLPPENVQVDLDRATASMHAENVQTRDFGDLVSDLMHGPSAPATASFRVQWSGISQRAKIRCPAHGWAGEFIEDTATIEFSTQTVGGLSFVSDAAATGHTEFAMIGHERNGVFFPQGTRS